MRTCHICADTKSYLVPESNENRAELDEWGRFKCANLFDGSQRLGFKNKADTAIYVKEHLGSTKLTANLFHPNLSTGLPVQTSDADPYGIDLRLTMDGETPVTDPHGYTGQEREDDLGLYYYGARFYMPEIGRFIQVDPAREFNNPYSYVGNNPVGAVDPTGNAAIVVRKNGLVFLEFDTNRWKQVERGTPIRPIAEFCGHLAIALYTSGMGEAGLVWSAVRGVAINTAISAAGNPQKWSLGSSPIDYSAASESPIYWDYLSTFGQRAELETNVKNYFSRATGDKGTSYGFFLGKLGPDDRQIVAALGLLAHSYQAALYDMMPESDVYAYTKIWPNEVEYAIAALGFRSLVPNAEAANHLAHHVKHFIAKESAIVSIEVLFHVLGAIH